MVPVVLDRRSFVYGMAGLTGTIVLQTPFTPLRSAPAAKSGNPDDVFFIDGQGGPFDDEEEVAAVWPKARREELKRSGMSAWMVTINDVTAVHEAWDNTIRKMSHYEALIAANPDLFILARTAADIRAAKTVGKVALIFGTENTTMLEPDLDKVRVMADLGIRVVQLTYNIRNMSGDGALEPANGGISNFGRDMIARIEKERLLLDLSHGGEKTITDAVAAAKRPMSINHTGCKALADHPRNVTDTAIKAVADKGGVIGIYFMPYLTPGRTPTRDDVIEHLNHAVNVGGEDHVAIGTDNSLNAMPNDEKTREQWHEVYRHRVANGIAAPGENPDFFPAVPDYNSPMRFHLLADDLGRRGWKAQKIEKILGANLLRLYDAAWRD
jgi:membrane dipeptidase